MNTKMISGYLILVMLALWSSSLFATESAVVSQVKSISDFVLPDGRIDIDAIRRSGYQGSLDMKGVDINLSSETGEPIVSFSSPSLPADSADNVYWDSTFSRFPSTTNGIVYALTVYNGKLIVGGQFSRAGGVNANNIASWDGSTWSALGSGITGAIYVLSLTVYNNKLIAGGYFTTAGGAPGNYIAAWDGASWSALGTGLNSTARALTVYDNKLIVGGDFGTAGGPPAAYIAAWDGISWSTLGTGMDLYVYALTVYDSTLIAAGWFTHAGGVAVKYIAAWNGTSWSALGTAMDTYIYSLTVYNNQLVAGGGFATAGGTAASKIASWNGSTWSALGSGMDNASLVYSLTVYDGLLIAGGDFVTANNISANRIASWNGSSWSPLGTGMTNTGSVVYALTPYSTSLIAGGSFTTAGGHPSYYQARWTKQGTVEVNDDNQASLPEKYVLEQNYPNPFNPTTAIAYSLPRRSHVTIDIYNMLGEKVITLVDRDQSVGSYRVNWDGTDASGNRMATGVYLYLLNTGDHTEKKKMLLLK